MTLGCLLLVFVVLLLALWLNQEKKWKLVKAEVEASGYSLDWKDYEQPYLPDGENLLELPAMQKAAFPHDLTKVSDVMGHFKLLDYVTGMDGDNGVFIKRLARLKKVSAKELKEEPLTYLNELLKPYLSYAEAIIEATEERSEGRPVGIYHDPISVPTADLRLLRSWIKLLYTYAIVNLENDNTAAAFRGLKAMLTITHIDAYIPNRLDFTYDQGTLVNYCLPVYIDGLINGLWTDEQLLWFEKAFAQFDVVEMLKTSLVAERACFISAHLSDQGYAIDNPLDRLFLKKGLTIYLVSMTDIIDAYFVGELIEPAGYMDHQRIHNELADKTSGWRQLVSGANVADIGVPSIYAQVELAAMLQAYFDMAVISSALIRYQKTTGTYPDKLGELVPGFLSALPKERIGGADYHYQQLSDGKSFKLWSVGWNEVDDGGRVAIKTRKNRQPLHSTKKGDWVWPYPQAPELMEVK